MKSESRIQFDQHDLFALARKEAGKPTAEGDFLINVDEEGQLTDVVLVLQDKQEVKPESAKDKGSAFSARMSVTPE